MVVTVAETVYLAELSESFGCRSVLANRVMNSVVWKNVSSGVSMVDYVVGPGSKTDCSKKREGKNRVTCY